jgi:tripartite-type tricarboxylate transporter receptor subunit TctC
LEEQVMRILQLSILVLITLIATGAGTGASAAYPDKPIQLVVPYPPAGMTDVFARPIGQRLSERLGQPVVIVNKPGAGGRRSSELLRTAIHAGGIAELARQ